MEAAVARELDKQIATVVDCKFLKEDEVIRLCEQVSALPHMPPPGTPPPLSPLQPGELPKPPRTARCTARASHRPEAMHLGTSTPHTRGRLSSIPLRLGRVCQHASEMGKRRAILFSRPHAQTKEILQGDQNVPNIAAPVTVVGDIHGQFVIPRPKDRPCILLEAHGKSFLRAAGCSVLACLRLPTSPPNALLA